MTVTALIEIILGAATSGPNLLGFAVLIAAFLSILILSLWFHHSEVFGVDLLEEERELVGE